MTSSASRPFAPGQRVHLPFQSAAGAWSTGTVIKAEPGRFMVVWDDPDRRPGQARYRTWHKATDAASFRRGNPALTA